jgi:hypothetical protein
LKAFLRTEEKKREKERSSVTPVTPTVSVPDEINGKREDICKATGSQHEQEKPSVEAEDNILPQSQALETHNDGESQDANGIQLSTSTEAKVGLTMRLTC